MSEEVEHYLAVAATWTGILLLVLALVLMLHNAQVHARFDSLEAQIEELHR